MSPLQVDLSQDQVRYLLTLLDPIVGALGCSDHAASLAWQCERALDSALLSGEEA